MNEGIGSSGKRKKGKIRGWRTIIYAVGLDWDDDLNIESEGQISIFSPRERKKLELPVMAMPSRRSGTIYRYKNPKTNIVYKIKIIRSKQEFKESLETPRVVVVYYGHARYGRGPCFGKTGQFDTVPGQNWGDVEGPSGGLFRMGYPYLGVFASEILDHQYKARLVPTTVPINDPDSIPKKHLHPWIKRKQFIELSIGEIIDKFRTIKTRLESIHELYSRKASKYKFGEALEEVYDIDPEILNNFGSFVAGEYSSDQKFWCYTKQSSYKYWVKKRVKRREREIRKTEEIENLGVVLKAGWSDTTAHPYDLGETDLKCRAFAFFGCHTLTHNGDILRKRRKWAYDGKNGYLFLTTSDGKMGAKFWIYHLMTSPFISFKKSLRYASRMCNKEQKIMGYKIIYVK